MAINTNSVRIIIEETKNVPRRRSSIFERSSVHFNTEEDEVEKKLDEWNRRWGKDNADSAKEVLVYPKEYLQQIKQEKEMWKSAVNKVIDRLDLLQKNMEDDMVEHYPLSEEQEKRLLFIDSEIDKYFSTMTTTVRNIDITYFERKNKLRNIQNEMNLEFKLRIAAMENDINKLKSTKFNEE